MVWVCAILLGSCVRACVQDKSWLPMLSTIDAILPAPVRQFRFVCLVRRLSVVCMHASCACVTFIVDCLTCAPQHCSSRCCSYGPAYLISYRHLAYYSNSMTIAVYLAHVDNWLLVLGAHRRQGYKRCKKLTTFNVDMFRFGWSICTGLNALLGWNILRRQEKHNKSHARESQHPYCFEGPFVMANLLSQLQVFAATFRMYRHMTLLCISPIISMKAKYSICKA